MLLKILNGNKLTLIFFMCVSFTLKKKVKLVI